MTCYLDDDLDQDRLIQLAAIDLRRRVVVGLRLRVIDRRGGFLTGGFRNCRGDRERQGDECEDQG